ncbi:MucBP domain-containing protein [Enterococcus ureasiticus]|uniref:MucBP domain-containing protein n=1 Tax=Enterococcus ureasiticus TaxID=903984 RepID=UPI001A8D3A3D|nr:MucBP domain-containing protein [Enterococcus ureasiticus]MBO0473350.1 MucBP domain-containing protein [Enterococcus ureasiticus]
MKRIKFFSVCLLTTFLIILLISQPATIVYYAKEEERQFWELVNESALQEGKFTDEPQEIVFVYRKKTIPLPSKMLNVKYPMAVEPPGSNQTTQYGELLGKLSGIFLFGSTRS